MICDTPVLPTNFFSTKVRKPYFKKSICPSLSTKIFPRILQIQKLLDMTIPKAFQFLLKMIYSSIIEDWNLYLATYFERAIIVA